MLLLWAVLAETGLQMAFDDFVIERNLVSCLQTNEVDRENSGREEYSRLQIGEGENCRKRISLEWANSGFKNSCHSDKIHITMSDQNSGFWTSLYA